jgi:hypothetical protein
MTRHEIWHVAVLLSTLFAVAGVAILALGSLVFDEPPPGLARARPAILGLAALGGVLVAMEWLGVH